MRQQTASQNPAPPRPLRTRRWLIGGTLVVTLSLLTGVGVLSAMRGRTAVAGWSERTPARATHITPDAALRAALQPAAHGLNAAAYDTLVRYLIEGWLQYQSPDGARAFYPGLPSENGRQLDGLEGYARMLPMISAWLAAQRPSVLNTATGPVDLPATLMRGLLHGTDPQHPAYWGEITDYHQSIVEAADIALGLWLGRDTLWATMSAAQREQVITWLSGALRSQAYDGNWQLFPLLVYQALRALNVDVTRWDARMQTQWEFFKTFHRGNGWFEDPPHGFDYYNAWSIHYAMFWLQRMQPTWDPDFITATHERFVTFYKHLFGPQGHPVMGRSVCYRMAAPVPLLTAQALAPDRVSPGQAMRALDLTWAWFAEHGALRDGAVTQGLCHSEPAVQAAYSGPASCLWALRSLIVAYALDPERQLLQTTRAPLPVEQSSFSVTDPVSQWQISGDTTRGHITLHVLRNSPTAAPALQPYGWAARTKEWLFHAPRRPANEAALYRRYTYSTQEPLLACSRAP